MIAMILLTAFSLFAFFYLIPEEIPERQTFNTSSGFNGRTFPSIVACVIGVVASFQLVKDMILLSLLFRKGCKEGDKNQIDGNRLTGKKMGKILFLYLTFALYGFLFRTIGFAITTAMIIPVILFLLGSRSLKHYVGVIIFAGAVFSLFNFVLGVNVPW